MALVSCPACARQVSEDAIACPHCGHPLRRTHAAVQDGPGCVTSGCLALVIVAVALLALGRCVSDDTPVTSDSVVVEPFVALAIPHDTLRAWRPGQRPNAFGAEILVHRDESALTDSALVAFSRALARDHNPVTLLLYTSREAYDEAKNETYGAAYYRGLVANFQRHGNREEIRWLQQVGQFADRDGRIDTLTTPAGPFSR